MTVAPDDGGGLERLARYLLRAPVSLERLAFDEEAGLVSYRRRLGHEPFTGQTPGAATAPSCWLACSWLGISF